jgi:hypothetical protein
MFNNIRNLIQSHRLSKKLTNFEIFNDIEVGCSFDPLHGVFAEKQVDPLAALKYIHQELKITNIRLSIKWSVVEASDFDFSYYRPFFNYCSEHGIKIVLNVGPIKTMRWPEEHIPDKHRHLVKIKDKITPQHPIATPALSYLDNLLQYIKTEYSNNLIAIQGDNEHFNRFGHYQLYVTTEFEREVIKVIDNYFPEQTLFFNSAGMNDFKQIFNLVKGLPNRIILGVNYYYKVPYQHRMPILNKFDDLILGNIWKMIRPETLKRKAEQYDYIVEVSELQGEPWWPNALTPGNNFREFVFSLLRTQYLKPISQEKIIARYWGIEDFVAKFINNQESSENNKIKELIVGINSFV